MAMAPEPEGNEDLGDDIPVFDLMFHEAAMIYSILYGQNLCAPSGPAILDEIERREMFVGKRHHIPHAMEAKSQLITDLREFLVSLAGEVDIANLEKDVRKTLKLLEEG
jgi:hypothetical protein